MTNDKKLMLLAGVLALGMLAGCSSASAASAASGMAGSMPAASEVEEVSSEVRVLPGEEGVVMPIDQGSLEEMKTGSYKFAANISSVDAVPVETNGAIEVGKAVSEDKDNWTPYNTTVFTKDGVVSNILRIWVP